MDELFPIVYEDSGLLVVNKPAGLVCHPTKGDERSSLVGRLRLYFGPGGRARLINRLDRETGGVILCAKTPEATKELGRRWADRAVRKEYAALVHGWPTQDAGEIALPLGRDEASEIAIRDRVRPDGAPALTRYQVERRFERAEGRFARLRIEPQTGRKHQIRIHLAHLGHPLVGDKLYGPDEMLYLAFVKGRLTAADRRRLILPWQALHATAVTLFWRGGERRFAAPPEPWFEDFCQGRPVTWPPEQCPPRRFPAAR
jgi:23S rRNA pseudouridine1911/1915/1917 synthase